LLSIARRPVSHQERAAIAGANSRACPDRALTEFAQRYADQNERDYALFVDEVRQGRLEVSHEST
jgi:hypothetical protein